MLKIVSYCLLVTSVIGISSTKVLANDPVKKLSKTHLVADTINAGLKLPTGFEALKVADNLGRARHITVTAQGDIYVKLGRLSSGKGTLRLRDNNKDGRADDIQSFGNFIGNLQHGNLN